MTSESVWTVTRLMAPYIHDGVTSISYNGVCPQGHNAWWTQTYFTSNTQSTVWVYECASCGRGHAG